MQQPLITRPAYGQGRSATPVAESKLPSGTPGGKGLPLDDSIPGAATYAKPEEDIRQDRHDDESMYRVDDPGDIAKEQTRPDERDHQDFKPRYEPPGQDTTPKTKYPYRDGIPHAHNARTNMGPKDVAKSLRTLAANLESPHPNRQAAVAELHRLLLASRKRAGIKTASIDVYKRALKDEAVTLMATDDDDVYMTGVIAADVLETLSFILKLAGYRQIATKLAGLDSVLLAEANEMRPAGTP